MKDTSATTSSTKEASIDSNGPLPTKTTTKKVSVSAQDNHVAARENFTVTTCLPDSASEPSRLYFIEQCKAFPTPDSDHIPTAAYIESVVNLADFIGKIGLVFWSVRTEIISKINAVKDFYEKNPTESHFIDQMVKHDKTYSKTNSWFGWESIDGANSTNIPVPVTATLEGLLWSHRIMGFFALILRSLIQEHESKPSEGPLENLLPYFRDAYNKTLAPHMTWMMKIMFEVVMAAVPTRSQFMQLLSGGEQNRSVLEAQICAQIRPYVDCLEECNAWVHNCLLQNGYTP